MVVSPQDRIMLNKPLCWGCASLPGHRVLQQWCRSSHCSLLCPCTSDQCAAAECALHHECSVFWRHWAFFRMVVHVSNSTVFTGKGETSVKIVVWRELMFLICWRSSPQQFFPRWTGAWLGSVVFPPPFTRKEVESRLSLKVWHLLPSSLFPRE